MDELIRDTKILHPELSYQIIGACFAVYKEIGPGHKEEYYQRALAAWFKQKGIRFREQVYERLEFSGERIGSYRLDFLVEEKIVVEIKALERFRFENYRQVKTYLSQTGIDLGLLIRFSDDGVRFQRILRPFDP